MKTGLVLGGGGARGAYEAGVLAFLRDELEPGLGRRLGLDVLSGTSVGAINACFLASSADEPGIQGRVLTERWRSLKIGEVLRIGVGDVARLLGEFLGRSPRTTDGQGGLVDPTGIRKIVLEAVRWGSIRRNLQSGAVSGLAVSATHVASGRTVTFVQRKERGAPPWTHDRHFVVERTAIGPRHVLASAAIPMLFPAVRVGRSLYVDGGLRLSVPLAPALRLGAERVIVVSLRSAGPENGDHENERAYATAPFLFGKTLNALLLDRTEQDLDRLRRINSILEAGVDAFGPQFGAVINGALTPHRNRPVQYVRNILVRPSRHIGALAAEYARSPEFRRRGRGIAEHAVRFLAEREARNSADLASYMLFDGVFADQLIEMGRADARALGDAWVRFFSDEPVSAAEAAQLGQPPPRSALAQTG
ncbi:MAG TPA: patatin-like phospholipase family protein [Myxococcaceae bacterium]|nr:patatin-like phospholipase family protein [Myxococcaceae bacterium]